MLFATIGDIFRAHSVVGSASPWHGEGQGFESPWVHLMKIFIICSKKFYSRVSGIKSQLENNKHIVELPNSFDNPEKENEIRDMGNEAHSKWKGEMFKHSFEVIKNCDAILVLNFEKNGIKNYIGGATFLEMYDAFRLNKKIFLYNDIPEGILKDEINGFGPSCN